MSQPACDYALDARPLGGSVTTCGIRDRARHAELERTGWLDHAFVDRERLDQIAAVRAWWKANGVALP